MHDNDASFFAELARLRQKAMEHGLDMSRYHPLDHRLGFGCRRYYGGRLTHAKYWWQGIMKPRLIKRYWLKHRCPNGRHHWVSMFREGAGEVTWQECEYCEINIGAWYETVKADFEADDHAPTEAPDEPR